MSPKLPIELEHKIMDMVYQSYRDELDAELEYTFLMAGCSMKYLTIKKVLKKKHTPCKEILDMIKSSKEYIKRESIYELACRSIFYSKK